MTLFGRYILRQVTNAFLVILLTLTAVVWLATALRELNLITSQGQGILLFFQMTYGCTSKHLARSRFLALVL